LIKAIYSTNTVSNEVGRLWKGKDEDAEGSQGGAEIQKETKRLIFTALRSLLDPCPNYRNGFKYVENRLREMGVLIGFRKLMRTPTLLEMPPGKLD
jgi:hypothetical protein